MKKKWFVRSCVVASLCFASTAHTDSLYAQGTKGQSSSGSAAEINDSSVIALGIAPIDSMLPNVQHLARLIGGGQAAGAVVTTVNQFSNGLDRKRPAGVFVELDETGTPSPIVCLPISDFEAFQRQLSILGEPDDLGDGLYAYYFAQPVYLRNVEGWLVAGQSEDAVLNFDSTVTENLKGLVNRYDIRIQVNPKNVPADLIQSFLDQVQVGLEQGMAQNPELDEDALELARENAEQAVQNIRDIVEGTEKFVVGLAVDPKSKKTVLDLGSKFVSGSKFANQLQQMDGAKANLAGVVQPNSAITSTSVSFVQPEDLKQIEASVESTLETIFKEIDEKEDKQFDAEAVKKLVRRLAELGLSSAREGRIESAFDLTTDKNLNGVLAVSIADGKEVDAAIADFASSLDAESKKRVNVKSNAGQVGGGTLHRISVKLEDANEEVTKVLGNTAEIAIISAPKALYIAFGKDCEDIAKQSIARTAANPSSPASMATARVRVSQLAAFAERITSNPVTAALAAASASGNDGINVDSKINGTESVVRLTIEDQVIKGIKDAVSAAQQEEGF